MIKSQRWKYYHLARVFLLSTFLFNLCGDVFSQGRERLLPGDTRFGRAIRLSDQGILPNVSGFKTGQEIRVEQNLYMAGTVDSVSAWILIGGVDSIGSSTELSELSGTVISVTDQVTIGATVYEFTLTGWDNTTSSNYSKRFAAGFPVIRLPIFDFTTRTQLLPGTVVAANGDSSHRGFRIMVSTPFTLANRVQIFYVLETLAGTDLALLGLGGDGAGLAIATTPNLQRFGVGLRR